MITLQTIVFWLASISAAGVGLCAWKQYDAYRRRSRHNKNVREDVLEGEFLGTSFSSSLTRGSAQSASHKKAASSVANGKSLEDFAIGFAEDETRKVTLKKSFRLVPEGMVRKKWLEDHLKEAGLVGIISDVGFAEARAKLALVGLVLGGLVGIIFSLQFGVVLAVVGVYFGWMIPVQAINHRIIWRAQEMERHLPEMLDVVSIGMRSGLSFDRSLQIYCQRFDTILARELQLACTKWTSGLERRDDALRAVAASYDSQTFARVIETCIRSLRFGSSMLEGLTSAAREARVTYRARRQEQIAKAPVKMMVPTGVLILPAMLIMVLGPVLLELMNGGI